MSIRCAWLLPQLHYIFVPDHEHSPDHVKRPDTTLSECFFLAVVFVWRSMTPWEDLVDLLLRTPRWHAVQKASVAKQTWPLWHRLEGALKNHLNAASSGLTALSSVCRWVEGLGGVVLKHTRWERCLARRYRDTSNALCWVIPVRLM